MLLDEKTPWSFTVAQVLDLGFNLCRIGGSPAARRDVSEIPLFLKFSPYSDRYPAGRQCLADSLTGAVA